MRYPRLRLGDDTYNALRGMGHKAYSVAGRTDLHKSVDSSWPESLDRAIREMRDTLNELSYRELKDKGEIPKERVYEKLLYRVVRNIIDRDGHFLIVEGGRPRARSQEGETSPNKDPFLSHLCYFGFEGQASTEEYRQFWKEIIDFIKNKAKSGQLPSEITRDIRSIVKVYEEKHPGKKIDLSFLKET